MCIRTKLPGAHRPLAMLASIQAAPFNIHDRGGLVSNILLLTIAFQLASGIVTEKRLVENTSTDVTVI